MLTKEEAKEKIKALVKFYISQRHELDKESEGDIRRKLIDKMFKILGWDVYGDEDPSEVQVEESIKNEESRKKKADYVFRLHGYPELIVEAKAIKGVDMDDEKWKVQAVGYAYNLACSWAVLTNFVRTDIFYVDRANEESPIRKISDFSNLENFDENFERLWLLSKASAKNNLLEKETERLGVQAIGEKVGEQLYEDLKEWRTKLSGNIRKKYGGEYKSYEIEEIVQRVIDRLIFIRKLEDMEIEERKLDQLIRKSSEHITYYRELKSIFRYYREKYNSGLFGEDEKSIQEPDRIEIDNDSIKLVIAGMYKPRGRKIEYNFAVIDADVLGGIYEQYLAFILKETPKKTKLEGGKAHRKEQGIFYTPVYIVDYIVKNTISEQVKHKSLEDVLKIKILDPACGSGSFLIRAFGELCKVVEDKLKKGERIKEDLVFDNYSTNRLNLHQKITILKSCIYGVDLDKKAVEIAQLNLLLKLLEGETAESMSNLGQTKKLLPMLNENIKNGNSLIDDNEVAKGKAFIWEEELKSIVRYSDKGMLKEGYGFDVVIGNPPWISFGLRGVEKISDAESSFYRKKYLSSEYKLSIYALFVERAISLLNDSGSFSFILPDSFLLGRYFSKLRSYILSMCQIKKVIMTSYDVFSKKATTGRNVILVLKRENDKDKRKDNVMEIMQTNSQDDFIKNNPLKLSYNQSYFESKIYSRFRLFFNEQEKKLVEKIEANSRMLGDYMIGHTGVRSLIGQKKIIGKEKISDTWKRGIISGSEIGRYWLRYDGNFINIDPKLLNKGGWNPEIILNEKIMIRQTGDRIYSTLDSEKYYHLNNVHSFNLKNKILKNKYLLGILNSKLMSAYYLLVTLEKDRVMAQTDIETLEKLPVKELSPEKQETFIELVDKMLSLNKKVIELGDKHTDERGNIEREIRELDNKIDQEVYNLYGITKEEQEIIENSLK